MKAVKMNELDNVAVVLQPTEKNAVLEVDGKITYAQDDIPVGHKVALTEIQKDGEIIKYGKVIGLAAMDILEGQHVHCHNVVDITEELCDAFARTFRNGGNNI